jgi:predicted heme/steroid binding protein
MSQQGPITLTLEELSAFDGKDPSKPVYVALNGTIYDVSVSRHVYGPGGPYSYFSGCDAARGFVTGCFAEDRTPDMRGVEDMFLPLDDPEIDAQWTAAEMKEQKARELAVALSKVDDALKNWVKFFANSKKYHKVGYVKKEKNWLQKQPRRKLCEPAQQGRSKRTPRHGRGKN